MDRAFSNLSMKYQHFLQAPSFTDNQQLDQAEAQLGGPPAQQEPTENTQRSLEQDLQTFEEEIEGIAASRDRAGNLEGSAEQVYELRTQNSEEKNKTPMFVPTEESTNCRFEQVNEPEKDGSTSLREDQLSAYSKETKAFNENEEENPFKRGNPSRRAEKLLKEFTISDVVEQYSHVRPQDLPKDHPGEHTQLEFHSQSKSSQAEQEHGSRSPQGHPQGHPQGLPQGHPQGSSNILHLQHEYYGCRDDEQSSSCRDYAPAEVFHQQELNWNHLQQPNPSYELLGDQAQESFKMVTGEETQSSRRNTGDSRQVPTDMRAADLSREMEGNPRAEGSRDFLEPSMLDAMSQAHSQTSQRSASTLNNLNESQALAHAMKALQERVASLEQENVQLRGINHEQSQQAQRFVKELLTEKEKQVATLTKQKQKLSQANKRLAEKDEKQQMELNELKKKNEGLQKNVDNYHKEQAALRNKVKAIQEQLHSLQAIQSKQQEEQSQQMATSKAVQAQELKDQKLKWKQKLAQKQEDYQRAIEGAQEQMQLYEETFKKEREQDADVLKDLASKVQELESSKVAMFEEVKQLKNSLKKKQEQVNQLEAEVKSRDDEIRTLRSKAKEKEQQEQDFRDEMQMIKMSIAELQQASLVTSKGGPDEANDQSLKQISKVSLKRADNARNIQAVEEQRVVAADASLKAYDAKPFNKDLQAQIATAETCEQYSPIRKPDSHPGTNPALHKDHLKDSSAFFLSKSSVVKPEAAAGADAGCSSQVSMPSCSQRDEKPREQGLDLKEEQDMLPSLEVPSDFHSASTSIKHLIHPSQRPVHHPAEVSQEPFAKEFTPDELKQMMHRQLPPKSPQKKRNDLPEESLCLTEDLSASLDFDCMKQELRAFENQIQTAIHFAEENQK